MVMWKCYFTGSSVIGREQFWTESMTETLLTRDDVLTFLEQESRERKVIHDRIRHQNQADFDCIIDGQMRLSERIERLSDRFSMYTQNLTGTSP